MRGSDGTSKGNLTTIRISKSSPGRSTPSQKLFVPKRIAFSFECIPLIIDGFDAPLDWAKSGIFFPPNLSFIFFDTFSNILTDVNKTIVLSRDNIVIFC